VKQEKKPSGTDLTQPGSQRVDLLNKGMELEVLA
jgi:hypothetical protein